MTVGEITAMIMATVAIGTQVYQWWRGRSESKRDNGDAAESVANATSILIDPLNKRITEVETKAAAQEEQIGKMQKRIKTQEFEITELRAGVVILTNQIVALGHQPIYKPTPRADDQP